MISFQTCVIEKSMESVFLLSFYHINVYYMHGGVASGGWIRKKTFRFTIFVETEPFREITKNRNNFFIFPCTNQLKVAVRLIYLFFFSIFIIEKILLLKLKVTL